ncbi:MAG: amino-acid N-acetyltransferase [Gammaproteobacteria bacterium]
MTDELQQYVDWFRQTSPYIHAHRGRTVVLLFGGEAVEDASFDKLIQDIALLNSLGLRLVLVHGARPQIESQLRQIDADCVYEGGLRVTDDIAMECVKAAVGKLRVEIEARLSMGVSNSPMAGARLRVSSGNFVIAKPLGVREGVDYQHTGEVRRIDTSAISSRLEDGELVLLSCMGYSPTGEVFNLSAEDVATATAIALKADKLILLSEDGALRDNNEAASQLTPSEAESLLGELNPPEHVIKPAIAAIHACRQGVKRAHLVPRDVDGAVLMELFTRDGLGTLITAESYEDIRRASIDDVGGILELIGPLEANSTLVRRSREQIELGIGEYWVIDRDGMIIACTAIHCFEDESTAELACLAVNPDYRGDDRGDQLLETIESEARARGMRDLFILTTRSAHWFQERGFESAKLADLPVSRQLAYNNQRNSKVFIKALDS